LVELFALEAQVGRFFRKIRGEGAKSVWGTEHDENIYSFPGVEFLKARSLIIEKKLFGIVNKVRDIDSKWFRFSSDPRLPRSDGPHQVLVGISA